MNAKDKKFIERNMYEGESSSKPWRELLFHGLLSLFLIGGGCWIYMDIRAAKRDGENISMPGFIWKLYEWGGTNLILGIFIVLAAISMLSGIQKYRNKMS